MVCTIDLFNTSLTRVKHVLKRSMYAPIESLWNSPEASLMNTPRLTCILHFFIPLLTLMFCDLRLRVANFNLDLSGLTNTCFDVYRREKHGVV